MLYRNLIKNVALKQLGGLLTTPPLWPNRVQQIIARTRAPDAQKRPGGLALGHLFLVVRKKCPPGLDDKAVLRGKSLSHTWSGFLEKG